MDNELVCNIRRCHKKLETFAWVTSCSHIFCEECANAEFTKALTCPACHEKLPMKYDLVRVDLQPSEPHKSMLLAGLKPDTIMEICTRGISFWNYQACQELVHLESCVKKGKEKRAQLEKMCSQLVEHAQTEIASLKSQTSADKKEIESCKLRIGEMAEKLAEKSRQHQRLQSMYDALRRQCISSNVMYQKEEGLGRLSSLNNSLTEPMFNSAQDLLNRSGTVSREDFSRPPSISKLTSARLRSPAQRDLGLHEAMTPISSGLQFHRFFPDCQKEGNSPRDSARRKKLF